MAQHEQEQQGQGDVVVTRTVDASVERVWRAEVDPEDVMRWWGPVGFSGSTARMDVREGGVSLVSASQFVLNFADAEGRRISPAEAGLPSEIPADVQHVVELGVVGEGRTRVTVTEHGYQSGVIRDLSQAGQEQVMDKFAAVVSA